MFSMASRQDLDNWRELGNDGWSFDDLAPYYRKFETCKRQGCLHHQVYVDSVVFCRQSSFQDLVLQDQ